MVGDDMLPNREKLRSFRHEDAGRDLHLIRRNLDVEASTRGFLHALASPPGTHMRLVGPLVRCKAYIAIYAPSWSCRGDPHVLRREAEQGLIDLLDDGHKRISQLVLVDRLAFIEPIPVVVTLQAAKEAETCF